MTLRIIRPIWNVDDLTSVAAFLASSSVAETDHSEWSAGTTYAKGARVILAAQHRVYESQTDGNINKNPALNLTGATPAWLEVSATNRYKMFDSAADSQTSANESITVTLNPGRTGSLYLGGLEGAFIDVQMFDGATEIYNRHIDLTIDNVTDWFEYFNEPIIRKTDIELFDLPVYGGATLKVTITQPGGVAKCGTLVTGLARTIGKVQWKPSFRLVDFSRYVTDDFGTTKLVRRRNARLVSCQVIIDNSMFDEVNRLMAEYTSVNLLWSMSTEYGSLNAFGFKKDFDNTLDSPAGSIFNLQVQGLT